MNVDKHVLSGLIFDDGDGVDISAKLRLFYLSRYEFSGEYKEVSDYVFNHVEKFKKVPDIKTLRNKFKDFDFQPNPEPFSFYVKEAYETKLHQDIHEVIAGVESAIEVEGIETAVKRLIESAKDLSVVDLDSPDMSLGKKENIDSFVENYKQNRGVQGLLTGFKNIDSDTDGLLPGDFWVTAGRSGTYKTWIGIHVFLHIVRQTDQPCIFFTKEMTMENIQKRVYAMWAGMNYSDFRRNSASDEELHAMARAVRTLPENAIVAGREVGQKLDLSSIDTKVAEYRPAFVLIDGLYLFAESKKWEHQSSLSTETRDLMLQYPGVRSWVNIQLNRQDEVGGSLSYEQDATTMIFVKRKKDEATGMKAPDVYLSVVKNRDDVEGGRSRLRFTGEKSRFDDLTVEGGEYDSFAYNPISIRERVKLRETNTDPKTSLKNLENKKKEKMRTAAKKKVAAAEKSTK